MPRHCGRIWLPSDFEQLLLLAHLRRQRHITMRDLRSTLALLITGNKACIDIHTAHTTGNFVQAFQSLAYWQAVFMTHDGSDELLGDSGHARFPPASPSQRSTAICITHK